MKAFLDTSVLVAAFMEDHPHHEPSFRLLRSANKRTSGCAAHSLAELYSVLTRLPGEHRLSGDQAIFLVEEVERALTLITLDSRLYLETLHKAAERGIAGGLIYDFLLASCALKTKAETIYTWNVQDFERMGPDIALRVRTP